MTQTIGSRRQVWNGTAKKTSGGLPKSDLMMSHGRIVSKSKHFSAKKEMRLLKHGYGTQKGKFGYVKIGTKKHHKRHKKMRGGFSGVNMPLSPASAMGEDINSNVRGLTNYGNVGSVDVQEAAGMAGGKGRKHRMSRRMAGGSGMRGMSEPANAMWNDDLMPVNDNGSVDVQLRAGRGGGRRRKHRKMRGGTGKQMPYLSPANVENRALMA